MATIQPDPSPLATRLRAVRRVVLDLDGTIYVGGRLLDCTLPFLAAMKRLGIGCTFLTNNNSLSRAQYLDKLAAMAVSATADDLFTSTDATIGYLRNHHPALSRVFVLGTSGLMADLRAAGFEHASHSPQAVIVGFDTSLDYPKLCEASYWISRGLPYIATHPDRVCPTDQATVLPDCGAICALFEHATGRKPDMICGKPEPAMLNSVMDRFGVRPHETAMVGDRIYTDMAMARRVGALGVLVLTGETTAPQAAASDVPDTVVQDLAELQQRIAQSHDSKP